MNDEQKKDFDLALRELQGAAELVKDMIRRDDPNAGTVGSVRDILTRFVIPRLEAATSP